MMKSKLFRISFLMMSVLALAATAVAQRRIDRGERRELRADRHEISADAREIARRPARGSPGCASSVAEIFASFGRTGAKARHRQSCGLTGARSEQTREILERPARSPRRLARSGAATFETCARSTGRDAISERRLSCTDDAYVGAPRRNSTQNGSA